jgi:DNA polymerase IV
MANSKRRILHVDMDAFFAAIEQRDQPQLRGKPVLVGRSARRGVVCAASYEARPFGVHSAMSMAEAVQRCPQAYVLSPRHGYYAEISSRVFEIFHRFTPQVEGLSLDEAFLDVTQSQQLFGTAPEIAEQICSAIKKELDLTASAGVARSKFVAKIASDFRKPDGITVVPDDEAAFLAPLTIDKMWGLGAKTAPKLRQAGLFTFGDLAQASPQKLHDLLGSWGWTIHRLAQGLDTREVDTSTGQQSIGAEQTFDTNLLDDQDIFRTFLDHSCRIAKRLFQKQLFGRVVSIKLKYANFQTVTRQTALNDYVNDTDSIYEAACSLLERVDRKGRGVRLTGVSVSDLLETSPPPTLFPDPKLEKRRQLEAVMAKISNKFGDGSVIRAQLLKSELALFGSSLHSRFGRLPSQHTARILGKEFVNKGCGMSSTPQGFG